MEPVVPSRALRYAFLVLSCATAIVRAQTPARPMTAADSVFARARLLVAGGNGAAGRVLVDSMVTVATPGTPAYGEALFWRGTLATTSTDAENDFRTVVAEYPLSSHAGEALLQLAQLEVARGDRSAAITHLTRFLLENPQSVERPRSALLLVRIAFEQNEPQAGCVFLSRVLGEVPDSDVELRNQLGYFSPRCAAVDTMRVAGAAPADTAAKRDSTKHEVADTAHAAKGRFTLQVAAYAARSDADALAKRLKSRGLDVRVVASGKLFRVRVGRYATRAAATAAQKELKAKKIDAFVTEAGPDDK